LLCYLSSRVSAKPTDAATTLEYLQAAKRTGRADEIERITRDLSVTYEPQAVLAMLKEPAEGGDAPSFLTDPRPLINVCDRFELVGQMAAMLYEHNKLAHLKLYLTRINPGRAPQVVAGLLDAQCEASRVVEMLMPLGPKELLKDATLAPRLISVCEERERLEVLHPWLSALADHRDLPEEGGERQVVMEALHKLEPPKKGLWGLLG